MRFQQEHQLPKDEAKRRVALLLDYWKSRHHVGVAWDGDSARVNGRVKGFEFNATLTIEEKTLTAEGTDPGLLLRAATTAYLKHKLTTLLDPTRQPEDMVHEA